LIGVTAPSVVRDGRLGLGSYSESPFGEVAPGNVVVVAEVSGATTFELAVEPLLEKAVFVALSADGVLAGPDGVLAGSGTEMAVDTFSGAAVPLAGGVLASSVETDADAFTESGIVVDDPLEEAVFVASSADGVLAGSGTERVVDTSTPAGSWLADEADPTGVDNVAEVLATTAVGAVAEGTIGSTGGVAAPTVPDVVAGGSSAEMVVETFTGAGTVTIGGTAPTVAVVEAIVEIVFVTVVETLTGSAGIVVGSVAGAEPVGPAPLDTVGLVTPPVESPPGVPAPPVAGVPLVGAVAPGVVIAAGVRRLGVRFWDVAVDRRPECRARALLA
jgi:hypothetical protein